MRHQLTSIYGYVVARLYPPRARLLHSTISTRWIYIESPFASSLVRYSLSLSNLTRSTHTHTAPKGHSHKELFQFTILSSPGLQTDVAHVSSARAGHLWPRDCVDQYIPLLYLYFLCVVCYFFFFLLFYFLFPLCSMFFLFFLLYVVQVPLAAHASQLILFIYFLCDAVPRARGRRVYIHLL